MRKNVFILLSVYCIVFTVFPLFSGVICQNLSPKSFVNQREWIFPEKPQDLLRFLNGRQGISELIEILESEIANKIIHFPLSERQLKLNFSYFPSESGAHYLHADIYPLRAEIQNILHGEADELNRRFGQKSTLDEHSIGRISILISKKDGVAVPLIWEIQPSASWRNVDGAFRGDINFEKFLKTFPEWNWRKDISQALSRFFIIYGFNDVYARSMKSMKQHPEYSSEYVYHTSKINVQDFSDLDGFIKLLIKNKNISEMENKILFEVIRGVNDILPDSEDTLFNRQKKELRKRVVEVFNDLKNNLQFLEENFSDFKPQLVSGTQIDDVFYQLVMVDKLLSSEGRLSREMTNLSERDKEEIRWLNVKLLEKVFSGFIRKYFPLYRNKVKINKRDLKLNYGQVTSNRENWKEEENVTYSIWNGEGLSGEYRERSFDLHRYQKPDLKLKEKGLKYYKLNEIIKESKRGRSSNLRVSFNTGEERLVWDMSALMQGLEGDKVPSTFNDVKDITRWIRFVKGVKIAEKHAFFIPVRSTMISKAA